ncbi:1,3-beta-glucanosyltransferase gas1 [Ceratobasidium sp. 370]|nr:1,3-beta-glucanosyltransferase gas1 [Ceratobasidium sp. 370]
MLARILALAACALPLASALPKIHAKGKYLYDESGNRFYIKGVAYQEAGQLGPETDANAANGGYPEPTTYIDPLALGTACDRDLPYLKQLGVNAIRVYSVNSQLNHDDCMTKLNDAGIYTIIDLSLPLNGSINRAQPSWTTNLQSLYTNTIDAFSKYDNVLSYNVANEVINLPNNTHTAPFIKAAARDIKAYLKSKGSSALVGYSTVDASLIRDNVVQYLTCNDAETSVDIIGLNTYRWCGSDDYTSSGYDQITALFQNVPVPAYLSEFGCQKELPRLFTEVAAMFSDQMTPVWSGGVAFSYFKAQIPDFELVDLSGPNNETVTTNADFTRLQTAYTGASPSNSPAESSATQLSYPSCPPQGDGTTSTGAATSWLGSTNLPPTPQQSVCDCLTNSAFSCTATRQTAQSPLILGALLDYGCSLLGQSGMSCDPISENGATGTYGKYGFCDPVTKLNYVLTSWYQSQNRAVTACSFNNNATINMGAPTTTPELDDNAKQCLAGFAPTSVPSSGSGSGTKTGSSGNGAMAMHDVEWAAVMFGALGALGGAILVW